MFQYFGRLLRTGTEPRVKLIDAGTPSMPTGDSRILTVQSGLPPGGCFASTFYLGHHYCVPTLGAGNTKEIFVLLNTLVNLSTSRSALPATTSVLLQQ